jgi:2-dehydro-3-deoxyglucarate aldolase
MKNTTLKDKLRKRELTIGSWVSMGHISVPEILSNAGFEWLVVDMEHTTTDYGNLHALITATQAYDMAALVRVGSNDELNIKRAMDAGADGVVVPMINSAEEARKAVSYVKYPPVGVRGVGLFRAQKYGMGFEEYKQWVKDHSVVILQIEHIEGINALEEILDVPGVDGVIIGPYDLSGSVCDPGDFANPKMVQALEKYKSICSHRKMTMGFHQVAPDANLLEAKIAEGYTFIAFGADFLFMGKYACDAMSEFRKEK